MGSERMEMRKRQMSVQQESAAGGTAPAQQGQPEQANPRGSNACCFCWCCCCSCSWVAEGWSQSQLTSGERRGTPWTGRQSIAGPQTDKQPSQSRSHSHLSTILTPINLACMSLYGGRKPEHPERTHADTGRTCKLHTERPGKPGFEPTTFLLNEDREERNRKASYDVKEGTADCEDCPKPTLEEVRSWGQSFDKLMCCPAGRNSFRQFLRTEFSEENMLFWLACEEFSKDPNKSAIEERARVIYEDYISILSPKEVSLDSRVRESINRNMQEPTLHTFDDAQLQIYTLMQRDSYPRYMNSPDYKNLLNTLSEQSPES